MIKCIEICLTKLIILWMNQSKTGILHQKRHKWDKVEIIK